MLVFLKFLTAHGRVQQKAAVPDPCELPEPRSWKKTEATRKALIIATSTEGAYSPPMNEGVRRFENVRSRMASWSHPDFPHGVNICKRTFNDLIKKELEDYEHRIANLLPEPFEGLDRALDDLKVSVEKNEAEKKMKSEKAEQNRVLKDEAKERAKNIREEGKTNMRTGSYPQERASKKAKLSEPEEKKKPNDEFQLALKHAMELDEKNASIEVTRAENEKTRAENEKKRLELEERRLQIENQKTDALLSVLNKLAEKLGDN